MRVDLASSLLAVDAVATDLAWLEPQPFFFGAAVLPCYLSDPKLLEDLRPTEDVDAILFLPREGQAWSRSQEMERALTAHGWCPDPGPGRHNMHAFTAPCGVPVDIVMDRVFEDGVGLSERPDAPPPPIDWPLEAAKHPQSFPVPSGQRIRVPTPGYFLACKIAASRNQSRWEGQYLSKDLEDIAFLLAGCSTLLASLETGPDALRAFVGHWAREILNTPFGLHAQALRSSLPRSFSEDALDEVLQAIARLT